MIYTIGVDFGSNSVRLALVDYYSGDLILTESQEYQQGCKGVFASEFDDLVARQDATDYLNSLIMAFNALHDVARDKGISLLNIKSMSIDATGSTPIPITRQMVPLSSLEVFRENLNAKAWMWKDHSSEEEAKRITDVIREYASEYLKLCGGKYSSEWFWAKILHCRNVDLLVFDLAYTWVEFSDFVPAVLSGVADAQQIKRNACAAGHKGLFDAALGGFPSKKVIETIDPHLVRILDSLPDQVYNVSEVIGTLSEHWAKSLGLSTEVMITAGALDAHVGAIGSGVNQQSLVRVVGTSTCDIIIGGKEIGLIEGVSGIAQDSVIPGYVGIEGGQSAVGDLFKWFVEGVLGKQADYHAALCDKAAKLEVGESGLVALDWNNGNRNILLDAHLSGLILGQSLFTQDYEIYRALLEGSAFGALKIIDQIQNAGVPIKKIICTGGIPQKNSLLMQIYADVFDRPVYVPDMEENVAYGAAIIAAAAIKDNEGRSRSILQIQETYLGQSQMVYYPIKTNVESYKRLYGLYTQLHDAFGREGIPHDMFGVMKELIKLKNSVKKSRQ
ncbi:ribulokinase [Aureibacter tunicatorum]|uniref:L-ribulokinase n=1 Tax=Aureibacter tunicatorum TaxID=866807 RepID=A0AAE4BU01_9BACT|nr:ribulokinase [Aureibacter tunicatorum]MDR6240298.1 L-ribulokinase [Aureibacter tunicatorum]BDD05821.1 ribulokinase [Aureibacter tunicatorum]